MTYHTFVLGSMGDVASNGSSLNHRQFSVAMTLKQPEVDMLESTLCLLFVDTPSSRSSRLRSPSADTEFDSSRSHRAPGSRWCSWVASRNRTRSCHRSYIPSALREGDRPNTSGNSVGEEHQTVLTLNQILSSRSAHFSRRIGHSSKRVWRLRNQTEHFSYQK